MAELALMFLAMVAGGAAAFLLIPAVIDAARLAGAQLDVRARLAGYDAAAGNARTGRARAVLEAVLRGLPGSHTGFVSKLSQMRAFAWGSAPLAAYLREEQIACDKRAIWLGLALLSTTAGVVALALTSSATAGAVVGLAVPLATRIWAQRRIRRRHELLRGQVPDALQSLDAAICAGLGIYRAFSYAASCARSPLKGELSQVVWDVDAGMSLDKALDGFQHRVSVPEVSFVVVAMEVQHRSGGSLHQIIDTALGAVRESYDLERSLQVKTAQARLSARVVGLMPAILLGALMVISPGYLSGFTNSALGLGVLAAAIVLDVAGLLLIRAIMDVEV